MTFLTSCPNTPERDIVKTEFHDDAYIIIDSQNDNAKSSKHTQYVGGKILIICKYCSKRVYSGRGRRPKEPTCVCKQNRHMKSEFIK